MRASFTTNGCGQGRRNDISPLASMPASPTTSASSSSTSPRLAALLLSAAAAAAPPAVPAAPSSDASARARGNTADCSDNTEAADGSATSVPPPGCESALLALLGAGDAARCCCCCLPGERPPGSGCAAPAVVRLCRLLGEAGGEVAAVLGPSSQSQLPPACLQLAAGPAGWTRRACCCSCCWPAEAAAGCADAPTAAIAAVLASSSPGGGRYSTRSTSALTDHRLADTTRASTTQPSSPLLPSGASAGTSTWGRQADRQAGRQAGVIKLPSDGGQGDDQTQCPTLPHLCVCFVVRHQMHPICSSVHHAAPLRPAHLRAQGGGDKRASTALG